MNCITRAQLHGFGKNANQRFHAEKESFGDRQERPYAVLNVLEKEITQPIGLRTGQMGFTDVALENTRQLCDTPRGRIQAVQTER
jgi:hypothetical protein